MAGRQRCRNNSGTTTATATACAQQDRQTVSTQRQESAEMPMCRHVNLNHAAMGCGGVEQQLCELNRVLAEQNRILWELVQVARTRMETAQ